MPQTGAVSPGDCQETTAENDNVIPCPVAA